MNRIIAFSRTLLLLCAASGLAACGDDAAPAQSSAEGAGAVGDVEGGSISDDMLPLESVTSKAPSRGGDDDDDGDDSSADEGGSDDSDDSGEDAEQSADEEG